MVKKVFRWLLSQIENIVAFVILAIVIILMILYR